VNNRKNSSDVALVIAAIDMLPTGSVDRIVTVTFDSDFTAPSAALEDQPNWCRQAPGD